MCCSSAHVPWSCVASLDPKLWYNTRPSSPVFASLPANQESKTFSLKFESWISPRNLDTLKIVNYSELCFGCNMFGLSIGLSCIRMCRWLWGFGTIKVLGEHLHRLHTTTKSGGDPTIITFQLLLSIFPSACFACAKVHNDTFVTGCSNHISHFIVRAHSPFSQPKGHIKILQLARTLLLMGPAHISFAHTELIW